MFLKSISKIVSVFLIASMFYSLLAIGVFAAPEQGSSSDQDLRVLIQPLNKNDKSSLKSAYGARWDFESKGFSTTVNVKQYKALLKNKNVKIELVDQVSIAAKPKAGGEAVPSDRTPWGIEAIYNDPFISATDGGDNIRVAVLDTGTNINHPDLQANVEQCKDFSQNKSPIINGSCTDKNGHGTHVAGTVLANGGNGNGIYGVAPDAKLWAYRVLGNSGFGYSDDIAAAIRHAADEGKKNGVKVVISMSLGSSSKDSLIADAVTYAVNNGALVVAAAGNEGPAPNTIGFPGGLNDAIAVAALENVLQNGSYRIADFSSRGNPSTAGDFVIGERDVELSAPGRAIESTWSDGTYNTISGTSMATPHISGLAAKIWAENPNMTNQQLRAELQNRAKSNDITTGQYAGIGDDIASGFGFPLVK